MRLLFIHSKPFAYRTTEPTRFAEELSAAVPAEAEVDDALVVMFAAEKRDEPSPDRVAAKAALEVEKAFASSGAKTIALYPYPILSSMLAAPKISLSIAKKLREALEHMPLLACPFGWSRALQINTHGKPAGEFGRVVEVEVSDITRSVDCGREHPVRKFLETFRRTMLDFGFDECMIPAMVEEGEIVRQFSSEATLVLESSYTLTGLDRVPLVMDAQKQRALMDLFPRFKGIEEFRALLKRNSEGGIEPIDLLDEVTALLRIDGEQAADILEQIFPEFSEAMSVPVGSVLTSHAASGWFPVLEFTCGRVIPPIRMFSASPRFRRERISDALHLPESTSASVAIVDRAMNLDVCKTSALDILARLGLEKCTFRKKRASNYCFEPDTETEVFAHHMGEEIEIGDIGILSRAVLGDYGVKHPACMIDFGAERLALVLTGADNMRAMVYPMLQAQASFSDEDIAAALRPVMSPKSQAFSGSTAKNMANIALEHKDDMGPAKLDLFKGEVAGRKVVVQIFNWDAGKSLLSLAAMNEIYVHSGSILGLPRDHAAMGDKYADVYEEGVNSGLRFIDLVIEGFLAEAEDNIEASAGPSEFEQQWKITKKAQQVNLEIPEDVIEFTKRAQKSIKVGGPLFFGLRAEWK